MSGYLVRQSVRSLSLLSRIFGGGPGMRIQVGTDQHGNRYFEETRGSDRRPKRIVWSSNQLKDADDDCAVPVPTAEWDSWLRFRRADPPTQAELTANARLAALKAERGGEIMRRDRERREARQLSGDLHRPEDTKPDNMHSSAAFPQYPQEAGFEEYPGSGREHSNPAGGGGKK